MEPPSTESEWMEASAVPTGLRKGMEAAPSVTEREALLCISEPAKAASDMTPPLKRRFLKRSFSGSRALRTRFQKALSL